MSIPIVLLCVLLLAIAWYDFTTRMVPAILFVIQLGLTVWHGLNEIHGDVLLKYALTNLMFVLFQLLVLVVYFSLKEGKLINITRHKIGWGDLVMTIPLCVGFHPVRFIWFWVVSLMATLLFTLAIQYIKPPKDNSIPLAGWWSIALIAVYIFSIPTY